MCEMKDIEKILLCFDGSSLTELKIGEESTGNFLRLKRMRRNNPERQKKDNDSGKISNNLIKVESGRVGIFNSKTSEGDLVKERGIIGEIVSLKTPTSIESPCDGKIIRVYPENGDSVEYGQLLMLIETKN